MTRSLQGGESRAKSPAAQVSVASGSLLDSQALHQSAQPSRVGHAIWIKMDGGRSGG